MGNNEWIRFLSPGERASHHDITAVTNSAEWFLRGTSGLLAICFFIAAGHRKTQGDTLGATLSSIGALVCALAPLFANKFVIGE